MQCMVMTLIRNALLKSIPKPYLDAYDGRTLVTGDDWRWFFLRCSNLTLGYTLPVTVTQLGVKNLRAYAMANQPVLLDSLFRTGSRVHKRSAPLTPGVDYSAYPKAHSYGYSVLMLLLILEKWKYRNYFSGFILPSYALRVWIILDTESPSHSKWWESV